MDNDSSEVIAVEQLGSSEKTIFETILDWTNFLILEKSPERKVEPERIANTTLLVLAVAELFATLRMVVPSLNYN